MARSWGLCVLGVVLLVWSRSTRSLNRAVRPLSAPLTQTATTPTPRALTGRASSCAPLQAFIAGSTVQDVPFFPRTIEELASDAVFSTKIALISNIRRVRLDLNTRMTKRSRQELEFLLTYARMLLDDEMPHVHLFLDERFDVERARAMWAEMATAETASAGAAGSVGAAAVDRVKITAIGDSFLELPPEKPPKAPRKSKKAAAAAASGAASPRAPPSGPRAFVIFGVNNLACAGSSSGSSLLEEVEALCFHAALRNVPVVLINPVLVSTASDSGARDSLLLGDFEQCYSIKDDYFMLDRRDRFCGLVQRAATGFDLFLLEGLVGPGVGAGGGAGAGAGAGIVGGGSSGGAAINATRLHSWPRGAPVNLRSTVARLLLRDGGIQERYLGLERGPDEVAAAERAATEARNLDFAIARELARRGERVD